MDYSYPYIASLTREPFLFYEMRSTAKLMSEGLSDEAIANASTGERVKLDKSRLTSTWTTARKRIMQFSGMFWLK